MGAWQRGKKLWRPVASCAGVVAVAVVTMVALPASSGSASAGWSISPNVGVVPGQTLTASGTGCSAPGVSPADLQIVFNISFGNFGGKLGESPLGTSVSPAGNWTWPFTIQALPAGASASFAA